VTALKGAEDNDTSQHGWQFLLHIDRARRLRTKLLGYGRRLESDAVPATLDKPR
jgi:hypothetical protein